MTGLTSTAIAAVRARFKEDADAVLTLRAAHKTVRPFGDGYSVNEVPVDSAELNRLADELRAHQAAKAKRTKQKTAGLGNPSSGKGAGTTDRPDGPGSALADLSCGGGESRPAETTYSLECGGGAAREEMPASEEAAPASAGRALDAGGAIPPRQKPALGSATGRNGDTAGVAPGPQEHITATCRCSRPKGHGGRCWVMRGMPGPTLKRRPRQGGTCRCGAPLSISARGDLCRKCHLATVRKTSGQAAQVVALWCEVEALKSRAERAENALSAIRAQLDMEGR